MSRLLQNVGLLLPFASLACASEGTIEGDLTRSKTPAGQAAGVDAKDQPPAPRHQKIGFTWESTDGALSGEIQTTLPDGEQFSGLYHEITTTTTVDHLGGFYGGWYGGPWAGGGWGWGGAWPYYEDGEDFITHYSGRVVAMLDGTQGTHMRCHFSLDDGERGMKAGGQGECQLSNGDRITSIFLPV